MIRVTTTLAVALAAAGPASGQELSILAGFQVAPDHVLEEQRAGLIGSDGMQIDIGLEQVTSVNGEIVHRSVLRALGPLDGGAALESMSILASIREGGIDIRPLQVDGGGWVTAIQNSLDNQSITHEVIMDLRLSNIPALRSELGRALERALADTTSIF